MLERNQSSFIEQSTRSMVQNARVGRVEQVFEHSDDDDYSNFEVDVKILGDEIQHRSIPYQQPSNNEVIVPSVGDKVMVEYRQGDESLPIARNIVYTNKDRPPLGKAGLWRKRIASDGSPAGSGDLYVESYTDYDVDPSIVDPTEEGTVQESWIRLAKKSNDDDTNSLPANVELYDSPATNEAHVTIELNKVSGADSAATWGIKFNLKTGEFKLVDPNGYGIVSDGSGNFSWHYKSLEYIEETGGGTLSL